jgi:hypothetical protein
LHPARPLGCRSTWNAFHQQLGHRANVSVADWPATNASRSLARHLHFIRHPPDIRPVAAGFGLILPHFGFADKPEPRMRQVDERRADLGDNKARFRPASGLIVEARVQTLHVEPQQSKFTVTFGGLNARGEVQGALADTYSFSRFYS